MDSPGIERHRAGRGFSYLTPTGRRVRGEQTLARIRAIAIPPAWTEVWISPDPKGHIQATGRDAAGRRQYRYHAAFRRRRDAGKFDRVVEFGETLPRIRRRVRADLGRRGLPREKVLAAVVALLELTSLRVGNPEYAALNKSFGLSTLRDRHARISGSTIRLRFRGKGGRTEQRTVIDRRLASVVRRCQELPGQELFQYEDEAGEVRPIASEDVNEYIRDAAGNPAFSAKDFRTWTATVAAYRAMRAGVGTDSGARGRRALLEALRHTAEELGNTLAVTRASYVHPGLVEAFEADGSAVGPGPRATAQVDGPPTRDEELDLLRLLRHASRTPGAARRPAGSVGDRGGGRRTPAREP
ncbi:MAG TPA: DNA topoisomerase IB [Patescibacteria group bacterium]|nr:DNA topoisomerase IB [Patescibacteria group bacterium]